MQISKLTAGGVPHGNPRPNPYCGQVRAFTFSERTFEVPALRGFGMYKSLNQVREPLGTLLGRAVLSVRSAFPEAKRLIVITDEQSNDRPDDRLFDRGYIINVASAQNGIGHGRWITINGWSEHVINYIQEIERDEV